jgi:anti-sigma-K factor RskA
MRCHYPDLLEAGNEEIAMIDEESERHEIEALLPWYAAGTLSRREADLVERALAGDSELARRYELVRQELTETIHLNQTLGAPSGRATEKLFAAIDADDAAAPRGRRRRISRTPSLATASTLNNDAPGAQRS